MIGLDTGFFIKLLEGDVAAIDVWNILLDDEEDAVVSCLTLFELNKLSLKGKIEKDAADVLSDAIQTICLISWLDNNQIVSLGAKLSYSLGMHTTDALILSGFVTAGVNTIYTTDSDLEMSRKKGVKVVNLQGRPAK